MMTPHLPAGWRGRSRTRHGIEEDSMNGVSGSLRRRRALSGITITAAALVLQLLLPPSADGGQVTAASIIGQVSDESGAVLPGVTVTVASPALQVKEMT